MDKNAIKKYAVWARNELIARVSQKAQQYGITAEGYGDKNADSVNGVLLSATEKKQRQALIAKIEAEGFEQVMEEVAYTWFNRFTALRFMEVNNYLPSHTRVFTNEANEFKPQILADAISLELDGLDMDKVFELKNANKDEELYKYLLIVQCNALNSILPGMFQKISDYTELLLPDYLLRDGSVISKLISEIEEADFDVSTTDGQIEIIGWLYQYYISEKHEAVVDPLHGKEIKKEEIPAATQLFTTDWVVRYIVDNSIGRYWIERNPGSALANELEYFIPQCGENQVTVAEKITPQELTVFDPCVGSGHFLVYAFDVLMKIYVECGYSEREAAAEIVEHNLHGLDIDGRAVQLAYFAVMMNARKYDRRFLGRNLQPMIFEISDANIDSASIDYFCANNEGLKNNVRKTCECFKDGKEYGSITIVPEIDFEIIAKRFSEIENEASLFRYQIDIELRNIINVAKALSTKYAIVATNPPYLNKYDNKLKEYINDHYKDYNGDLFSVFIYKSITFCKENGYAGLMTPFVWMFIKKYEKLREFVIKQKAISSLIQMEYSAFEEATVPICSFVLKNGKALNDGQYIKLSDFKGGMSVQGQKVRECLSSVNECSYFYQTKQSKLLKIPGSPIAYWVSDTLIEAFETGKALGDFALARNGMKTGDNNKFLRFWWEVDTSKFMSTALSYDEAATSGAKWFPYNKGGEFRKWYGNNEYVVDWENAGQRIFGQAKADKRNVQDYPAELKFVPSLSWSLITSAKPAFRYKECNLSDIAGMSLFTDRERVLRYLGFLNSPVSLEVLQLIAPTINFQAGDIARIPVLPEVNANQEIIPLVEECIKLSQEDWDSYEQSWDFQELFAIKGAKTLEEAFEEWKKKAEDRFLGLKERETKLNEIFIEIYGMSRDLSAEVDDYYVTVRKAQLENDFKRFISYAVGCMFGRYSLDVKGVAFAGGQWSPNKYSSFTPDDDNIIPICDDEYFEDDIVAKFISFVESLFGKESLEENLNFISAALGGKGSSRDVIRDYFMTGFYEDHIKTYQKRPIYWLFDSGKKNGFKCLIYMHRYQADTVARIRTDYVHEQQSRYRTAIADLEQRINSASTSERVKLSKQLKTIQDQAEELGTYEEKIHHLADQMISIDLDDGVKENYAKFQDVLAKIK